MEDAQGYSCTFVERPPELIETDCPFCLLVLREPHQVTCCGKSFCRACINKVKSGSDVVSCPCCNHTKIVDFPDVRLQQTLYGLRVYCTNREQGCEWSGELRELDNHLNRPAKFNDSSTDSQKPGQRSGIPASHSCPYVLIRCTKCNEVVKRIELEDHNLTECLQAEPVQDILSKESHDLTECLQIEPLQNRINQCNHEVSQFAGSKLKCPAVSQNHMITGLMILLAFFVGLSISLIQKSQNDGGVSMPLMKINGKMNLSKIYFLMSLPAVTTLLLHG